jgi:WD40-like Beta Propeller Repeat
MRRAWIAAVVILLLATGIVLPAQPLSVAASSALAKKYCHYVTKKVHGKKKRVKVCTTVKPAPTAAPTSFPTPTVTPTPSPTPTVAPTPTPTTLLPAPSPPLTAQHGLLVMSGADGQLFTIRDDGTGKVVLPGSGSMPSWTPDGRIIFVSNRGSSPQIWIMNADGSNPQQAGNLSLEMNNPIAKPQLAKNDLIVFSDQQGAPTQNADNPGPQNGTYVMHQDGSGLKLLFQHCTAPSLALSGQWLTCTKEIDGHREIWRINTDGTGQQQLTFAGDPNYPDGNASSISPDESTVALFSGKESDLGLGGFTQSPLTFGHRNVAVIPAAGGARKTITACTPATTPAEFQSFPPGACLAADNPAWSPDGKWLIYDRGGPSADDSGTWMIGTDGQNNRRVWPDNRGGGNVPMKYIGPERTKSPVNLQLLVRRVTSRPVTRISAGS